MSKFILGQKNRMTQIYDESGAVVPVTVVKVDPCTVVQLKDAEKDGYVAVQVGAGTRKEKNIAKPQQGHMKDLGRFATLREFRVDADHGLSVGDTIDISQFEVGDTVKVTGVSKGKGFQGVVRRYNFKGAPASHGTKDQVRMPGSIGATGPQRVFKGTRMAGRMGGTQVTVANLHVAKVDAEKNELYIRGAVPGAKNGYVKIITT